MLLSIDQVREIDYGSRRFGIRFQLASTLAADDLAEIEVKTRIDQPLDRSLEYRILVHREV